MSWLQVQTLIQPSQAENFESWLLAAGACAITLTDAQDQPVYEPVRGTTPLWASTHIFGLFDGNLDATKLSLSLQTAWQAAYPQQEFPQLKIEILEDKDWVREWMDSFQPLHLGGDLWIVPSWLEAPQPEAVNLILDPGLAFGTGTHPTTKLCLQWLAAQGASLQQKTVLDYGCGSGILGIAAILLGAAQAWGTDIDPQALEASRANAVRNGLAPEIFPVYYPESCPQIEVDVLLANILAGPLISLAPTLAQHVKAGGQLVLSGILEYQATEVMQAFQPWFKFSAPQLEEEWVRLDAQRLPV